jgi:hypothetical protein
VLTHRPPDVTDPDVTFLTTGIREADATALAAAGGRNLVPFWADLAGQCIEQGRVDLATLDVTGSGQLATLRFRVVE